MNRCLASFGVMCFGLMLLPAMSADEDPFAGVWKFNRALSEFNPGPPPEEATLTHQPTGPDEVEMIAEIFSDDGTSITRVNTVRFDGREYPVTGDPSKDAVAAFKIDPRTLVVIYRKDGQINQVSLRMLTEDGQVTNSRQWGVTEDGELFHNKVFLNRIGEE